MTDAYFQLGPDTGGSGRFVDVEADVPFIEFLPGLGFRPVLGKNVMVNFVYFEANTEAPLHSHDEEQVVVVIDGEFEFEAGGERRLMRRGQVAVVPSNVPHAARTFDSTCFEVDVFCPPRQGLLDLMRERAPEA